MKSTFEISFGVEVKWPRRVFSMPGPCWLECSCLQGVCCRSFGALAAMGNLQQGIKECTHWLCVMFTYSFFSRVFRTCAPWLWLLSDFQESYSKTYVFILKSHWALVLQGVRSCALVFESFWLRCSSLLEWKQNGHVMSFFSWRENGVCLIIIALKFQSPSFFVNFFSTWLHLGQQRKLKW